MFESTKEWARARMAPSTWERLSHSIADARSALSALGADIESWVATARVRLPSSGEKRYFLWRFGMASSVVIVPALILALFGSHGLAIPSLVLLIAVGFSVYFSDWLGGFISTVVSVLAMLALFVGEQFKVVKEVPGSDLAGLVTFVVAAGAAIATIEHLRNERAAARLEAAAMRAANTALSAVEIAAAGRPPGDHRAYNTVLESLLAAMARVNRASAGALYLLDDDETTLVRVATYGELSDPVAEPETDPLSSDLQIGSGFAGRVAQERRPLTIFNLAEDPDTNDILQTNTHVRSVVGVPLIDPNDRVVGVCWVGLYVRYRFSATAIARLQALSHRTVAFMESARLADLQEEMLDRVQDDHRRLQSVIQTMPEAMMVVRPPSGQIVASNAAAQRMFGIRLDRRVRPPRVDQLRVTFTSGLPDQELPIVRAMHDGEIVTGVELTVTLPDGNKVPVVASAAPLLTEDGEIDAVVGVFQDVRPLKEAERLRDEFISVVSHELRSPLTPIRGFAQVVARELAKEGGHEQQVAWLSTLQIQVDRMTRLVDDLLDVSRLRAGRLMIRRTDVDLVSILQAVVDARQSTEQRHRITFESPISHLPAELDGDRIYQVIDNLVSNAIKYTDGGTIRVVLSQSNRSGWLRIDVTDEGKGIPLGEREHLFTPFYRSRSASESAVPGLGLGLYICRELIQAHGGDITVEDAESGGARFAITLPGEIPASARLSA